MLWQYFGVNIGNDINFGGATYDTAVVDRDCNYLVGIGIQYFRVNIGSYNNAIATTQIRYLAQKLKELGAHVQYGVANTHAVTGGIGADAEKRTEFEAKLATEAAWAQSIGIERFQIGNEQEITIGGGVSEASTYTYWQTLPAVVTGAGFTGEITASCSQDHYSEWVSNGKGNFTDLGIDIYGDGGSLSNFISQNNAVKAALGADTFLSEWAYHAGGSSSNINIIDPELYSKLMMDRLTWMKANYTRPCYLHCWRFNGGDVLDLWAAKKDSGELRLFWYDITGQRRSIIQ